MRRMFEGLAVVAVLCLAPAEVFAQTGQIAGTIRDEKGLALPGVVVEVTSPQLIEKVRSTTSGDNGQYRITSLPVGTYTVTFRLEGFTTLKRGAIELSSDFTAPVNVDMTVGRVTETVFVTGEPPTVDVQNARQNVVLPGEVLRDLPTGRNVSSLLTLVPGLTSSGSSICSGGVGPPGLGAGGVQTVCNPVLNGFTAHGSINDPDANDEGRLQVDGMSLSGVRSASTSNSPGGPSRTSRYLADVANAQEISFSLSGSLGEAESGGAILNIVPRTGGNRYAGNFFTSYTRNKFFATNNDSRSSVGVSQSLENDHDISGAFGGPIIKDRLWFYSVARHQGKETRVPGGYYNANEGVFGANYLPLDGRDGRELRPFNFTDQYRNINTRLTLQASPRNKFNIFWDEQESCYSPCRGSHTLAVSPEANVSILSYPSHVGQISWTNPFTNHLLFDAGFTFQSAHEGQERPKYETIYRDIPKVVETGNTAFNTGFQGITSGSPSVFFPVVSSFTNFDKSDAFRSRASASYITGTHNVKVGYDGAYLHGEQRFEASNNLRLQYAYTSPAAACANADPALRPQPTAASPQPCGNTSLYFPDDPINLSRRPVPSSFNMNTGGRVTKDTVWFTAFYAQDQWTFRRLTLNGALRYDHTVSSYGPDCVGPDLFVPTQYCYGPGHPDGDGKGVNFHDITPRWGVAWDLFGTGKTALKWNMGKFIQPAAASGIYIATSPGYRTSNNLTRGWQDLNGNRVVDCDLMNNATQNLGAQGGDFCAAPADAQLAQFGRNPFRVDESNAPIGFADTHCGRQEAGVSAAVQEYCNVIGQNLLEGWGNRRYEWQWGLGIQHEILPRLSGEVTYNHRDYGNISISDNVGLGCDLIATSAKPDGGPDCIAQQDSFINPDYDFYHVVVPSDARLPGGGGYTIPFVDRKTSTAPPLRNALTNADSSVRRSFWRGVDTNFTLRAGGGLRLSGGTSTGSRVVDNCVSPDAPLVRNCHIERPFQTNIRATATYTTPTVRGQWVGPVLSDWLVSTVFRYIPGQELSANETITILNRVIWEDPSASRAGAATLNSNLFGGTTATTTQVNLLDTTTYSIYGEGARLFDLKFAKNIRFSGTRVNIGVDVYNLFNTDAATGYCMAYPTCTINGVAGYQWGTVSSLVTPRFGRLSVQVDF